MLIITLEDLQEAVPVSEGLKIERVRPYLKNAEVVYLVPMLGKDLLAELDTALEATPSELQAELIGHLRFALGNLAMMDFAPVNMATVGESGTVEINTEGAQRAGQWVARDQMAGYISGGFRRLEEAIRFLEENREHFASWETSSYYLKGRNLILPSALVFDDYYNIGKSGWLYLQLLAHLRMTEDGIAREMLGTNFLLEIKNWIAGGEEGQSAEQKEVIRLLRTAVASETMARAIPRLAVAIGTEGVTLSLTNTTQSVRAIKPATPEEKQELIRLAQLDAAEYKGELVKFLKANADLFPTWKNSVYNPADTGPYKNDPDSPVVIL